MFMSIWSALFPAQLVSLTSSQSWTGRPAGRKRYCSPPCPPPTAQPVSFMGGSSGGACQQPSPVIEARNSLLLCGLHCAPSSTSLICRPLPIIPRQTAPWSDFTAGLRMRCGPAQLGPTARHQVCLEKKHIILPSRGSIWSTTSPSRPVSQLSRTAVADIPPGAAVNPEQQTSTPGGPPQPPGAAQPPRRTTAHPLCAQPPLSLMYDGPYLVLERSLRFFKIQVGTRQDAVSTLRLKPCRSPPDAQPAAPPRRGRPPMSPAAASSSADVLRPPATRRRRVTFRCPVAIPPPESQPPPPLLHPSGRPARRDGRPQRYLSSLDSSAWGGRVGADGNNDDI